MKEIVLTKGKIAFVDDEDYEQTMKYRWRAQQEKTRNGNLWYAIISSFSHPIVTPTGQRYWMMHRLLLQAVPGQMVDHVNGNGLDNRKCNLRWCTNSQNQANTDRHPRGSSQYRGVHWRIRDQKWGATIKIMKRTYRLGHFLSEEEAAIAYDHAALAAWGEFARLNFLAPKSNMTGGDTHE